MKKVFKLSSQTKSRRAEGEEQRLCAQHEGTGYPGARLLHATFLISQPRTPQGGLV